MNNNFKVGQRIRCVKEDSFLPLKVGKLYTVSALGGISVWDDMEYIQLKELPGCAYKAERFAAVPTK